MTRAQITLSSKRDRDSAVRLIAQAPTGTRVLFTSVKRSRDQNSRLWAMLTEVATQLAWHGRKLTADNWKVLFMDALEREPFTVPNIDNTGFVSLGRSSSRLSTKEFSDLIELIHAFAANHGVTFRDDVPTDEQAA